MAFRNYSYSIIGHDELRGTNENVQIINGGKMGNKLNKFILLMWKNWTLQYRKPIQTIVEIIAPVLFSVLLVLIRSLVDPEENATKIYTPFCPIPLAPICNDSNVNLTKSAYFNEFSLVYSPNNNTQLNTAMNFFVSESANFSFKNVIGYENAKALEAHFITSDANSTFAALQFDDSLQGKELLPENLNLHMRFPGELRFSTNLLGQSNNWFTNLLYPIYQVPGPRASNSNTGAIPEYYNEGFLTLQMLTTYNLMFSQKTNDTKNIIQTLLEISPPLIKMQRFPYYTWMQDPLLQALESFVSLIILLSFVYTCINTVKVITMEKEKQLKEAMKIMGLSNWLHWTAWFLKTFIYLLISVILIIILLKVSWYPSTSFSVFTYADPLVMLLFLILYICATITFSFAINVFFSKANTASTIAGLAWFLSYAPYLFLQNSYSTLGLGVKIVSSFGSNTAMAYGFQLMLMFEGSGEGVQWSNLWKTNTPDDNLTLGIIMIMLVVDSIIYLAIALYVETVFPGEYGVPLPWNYLFTSTYWLGHPRNIGVEDFQGIPANESEFFEKDPSDLNAGIQIRNLRKVFKNKAAVRNFSLNMYEDQITVLMGHNGAGKTSLMSMLTGMFPPTSGTAIIDGHDIHNDMDGVRASLALCPQHNILFDELTVREHFYFYSKLKGLKKSEIQSEVEMYINILELQTKADMKSSTLSGGMKRKVCVGIALCGKSRVVMLDEPTAGMDPSARRALWNLLQEQKKGRTILLSTHFMDEADLLGDRIAIMAGGELQCYGSSFFLKKKYGAGYLLIMDKNSSCNPDEVTELLRKHIPNLEIHGNIGSELIYLLAEDQSPVFEEMLRDLEQNCNNLGIFGYGISLTTLEEVFMKVGADHGQEETYNNEPNQQNGTSAIKRKLLNCIKKNNNEFNGETNKFEPDKITNSIKIENVQLLTGYKLIKNQYYAMFVKKVLSFLRTWILQIIQIGMPIVFLIIAIVVSKQQPTNGDLPERALTLNSYDDPITLVEEEDATLAAIYTNMLQKSNHKFLTVANITEKMLNLTRDTPSTVRMRYIAGVSFENQIYPTITAWFNNDPYHSPPLALGLALNTVYKNILGEDHSITYSNYPLPFTAETKIQQLLQGNTMGFTLAFNLGFSMAFVSSFYILFYVRERICKSKHLQFISGVNIIVFWTTSYLCDLITFIITSLAIIITFVAFQEDGFKTADDLGRLFLIFLYFGCSMLPMIYFAAYLFEVPSTGYTRMTLFSIFTGVAAFLVIQVLGTEGLDLEYVSDALHWLFLIVPHYSLATGVRDTYTTYSTSELCVYFVNTCVENQHLSVDECWYLACHNNYSAALSNYCCEREKNYFKWESPGIGRNLLYSFLIGFLLFVALLISENNIFSNVIYKITQRLHHRTPVNNPEEDDDVFEERQKIHNIPEAKLAQDYTLVLKDITKYYKKFLAVNGLCLGVKRFECFGLLGVNGAGKTSTFKMMTGDVNITYGNAWVNGLNIRTQMKEVQKSIGYCPQFDALLDDLTARETLIMFALLRGVPLSECKFIANKLSLDFDFHRHLDKQVKALSGGNKRKLSTAIALIGDPSVIYLDEPTTGMDPATKRYLWNALCQLRDKGKCIILTSHSMEECEALCTRLAIMVNGEFKCLGSTQHLKNKFSEGYTLTIKVKKLPHGQTSVTEPIEKFVLKHFPKAVQREKHQELLTYYIEDKSTPWSRMFGILERGKKELNIEDYSLGQSSLEQVFLIFTKLQR